MEKLSGISKQSWFRNAGNAGFRAIPSWGEGRAGLSNQFMAGRGMHRQSQPVRKGPARSDKLRRGSQPRAKWAGLLRGAEDGEALAFATDRKSKEAEASSLLSSE